MTGVSADELPPHVRALAELLARQAPIAGAGGRRRRLELLFDEDGRLVEAFTHDRIGARELEESTVELIPPASPA